MAKANASPTSVSPPREANNGYGQKLLVAFITITLRIIQIIFHAALSVIYCVPGETIPPFENLILLDSATTLAKKIRTKKLTSQEVVQAFINRSKEVNGILNAVVDDRFEAALEDAKKADNFIETSGKSVDELATEFPFLGVPFTAKDCISIKGLSLTGGLYQRRNFKAPEDAECVASLRRAGGIPIAITNVPELALWWETYNKHYGRTRNPYNVHRIVGGSSGGEGCILTVAGSAMGIGSDIGGSIRIPSFMNGIFGHKPSTGVGSLHGHYPIPKETLQRTFVTGGPMSRFATDLLPMLKVLAPDHVKVLQLDRKVDITKLKYFFMEDDGGGLILNPVDVEIKEAVRKIVAFLKTTHGINAQQVHIRDLKYSMLQWFAKMKTPGESQLARELANNEGSVNCLTELPKVLLGLSNHTFPVIAAGVLDSFDNTYGSEAHKALLRKADNLKLEFQEMLGSDGVFIYPTHPTPPLYHVEPIVKPFNIAYTAIFNILGLPSTHVPMGLNKDKLPIGIQVIGNVNQDRLTIAVAEELERAFGGWVPPAPVGPVA